jgi:putative SOS response-associated peptidase YedK
MCYRVATPKKEDLGKYLGTDFRINDYNEYYHTVGQAHASVPVIKPEAAHDVIMLQWGRKPPQDVLATCKSFPDIQKFENQTLNTMAEYFDFAKKPLHESIVKQEPCLLFVNGFYEWRHEEVPGKKTKKTIPFFIHMPGKEPFAMAALNRHWLDKETGEILETVSIFTAPANTRMQYIHNSKNRMPAVLDREYWEQWLSKDLMMSEFRKLAVTYKDDVLVDYVLKTSPASKAAQDIIDLPEIQAPLIADEASGSPTLF